MISCQYIFALAILSGSGAFASHTRPSAVNGISTTVDNRILVELQPEDTQPANHFDLNGMTLVFTPDGRGGYSRDVRRLEWEETLGTEVTLEWERRRDGVEVELGDFEFDYAGRRWNSVFMSKHGLLTFGTPLEYSKHFEAWFSPMSESAAWLATTPTISALYKPAFGGLYGRDPLASQFVARFPDRVVVTWFASEYDSYRLDVPDHAERFQAILHADGAIQLNYGHITVTDGVVGLFSDVVEKGDVIASIGNPEDSEIPGHLDLLDVTLYESNTDALIAEWTMRGAIPTPPSGTSYSYRLYFDTDEPYFDGDEDHDFIWSVDVTADDGRTRGGTRLPTNSANRVALLVDDPAVHGITASIKPGASQYDDGVFVRGNWNSPFAQIQIMLPGAPPRTDLSRSDRDSSNRQSEVFHHPVPPDTAAIACSIIEDLGDRFDVFVFHSEIRFDSFQATGSDWRNYYNGVKGIGREDTWREPPCGDGRLLGHYARVVPIGQAGGRGHEWRNGNFTDDLNGFAHEVTHSWTAYLSYVESNGARGRLFADSFADGCRCHWRGELHAPAAFPWGGDEAPSMMTGGEGGGFWRDHGDGTFTVSYFRGASGLSWLDLYAMGLAEASEVRDLFVLRNLEPVPGNNNPRGSGYYWGTFRADKEMISIDQIVAAMGPREPSVARSRKEFNTGFVYLLEPGQKPDPDLLRLHRDYRDKVIEYWFHITGGRSRITTRVGPRITQEFPHFADGVWQGQSTTSDLVLVNVDTSVVHPAVYFYSPAGDLIAPESVVDVRGDVEATVDGGVTTAIEPSGEWTLATRGRNELVTGSVRVISDGPLGGILRFNDATAGVAGVGAGQPVNDAIFPARRQAGGINTGAAIRNLGEHAITVRCQLLQEGNVRMEAEVPLAVNGQAARFINELFPDTDTSDFVGSVRCRAPAGALFAGVALEMDFQNRIFTTLPVVPVPPVRTQEDTQLHFAHFANGSSIASDLVLVNVAAGPVRPAIYFHDQEGELIAPAAVVDVRGDLEVSEDGALTFGRTLRPLGERTLTTTGEGELKVGSVRVVSDGPVGGVLRFDHPELGVAGVGASQPLTAAVFLARRQADGINTGVAIRNLETETLTVTCKLTRNGHEQAETPIQLEANAQTARFIDEMFKEADTSDFLGSVRCAAPEGLRFTGVALEMDVGRRIFTTLPVVPIQ